MPTAALTWRRVPVLLLLIIPRTSAAEPRATAGILPVEGDPAQAGELNRALGRAVAARGVKQVLGPLETRARITGARQTASGLSAAKKILTKAEQQLLHMKRGEAVRLSRQAVDQLQRDHALFADPALLARARGVLALALLLKPADEAGARQAFHAALEVSPGFRSDPDHTPPRASRLLEQARKLPRATTAPAPGRMAEMGRAVNAARLVWVLANKRQGKVRLEVVVFNLDYGKVQAHLYGGATPEGLLEGATSLVIRGLKGGAGLASAPAARRVPPASQPTSMALTRLASAPSPVKPAAASKPWYRKWWVWTIVGVAVVGAGVGLGVGLSQGGETSSGHDFQFNFGG